MPKITKRQSFLQQQRQEKSRRLALQTTMINTEARKVSFEDSVSSSSCASLGVQSLDSCTSSSSSLPRTSCLYNMGLKNKMLTRRPTPLVSLQQLIAEESSNQTISRQQQQQLPASENESASQWGHFVDVIPQDDDDDDATLVADVHLQSSCIAPRRRGYEPYHKPLRFAMRKSPTTLNGFQASKKTTSSTDVALAMKRMQV